MKKIGTLTYSLSFRMISATIVLLLVFGVITSAIGYVQFTNSLTRQYNDAAFRTAETAVTLIDGDKIEQHLNTKGDSDEYRLGLQRLNNLCQKQNVTLIYVLSVDTSDYGRYVSLFNVANENSDYDPWEIGYGQDTTNEEYRQIYRDIYENGLQRGTVVRTSNLRGKEPHITSLIPVKGADGTVKGILCVQRPMSELVSGRKGYLRAVAVSTVLLALVASLITIVYLRHEFVVPVEKIMGEAKRFAQENSKTEHDKLNGISKIREISELGFSVEKMENDTLAYMDKLTRITAEKERIGTELSLATKIQASMLPNLFPPFPDRDEFDIFASMTPAKEVGGDFYDFFLIDEDHLGLVMADVSGKGVPAALFMMIGKTLVNNYAIMGGSPGEVLARVNNAICKKNENDMFITVWFGVLTISTGHFVTANAGHEYPAIRRADGAFELLKDKHGFVIGGMEGSRYREYEFTLGKGDTLFVYTDGVPEATNANNEMFETSKMLTALNEQPDAHPQALLDNVKKAVDAFVGDAPQFDDLTMMAIKML